MNFTQAQKKRIDYFRRSVRLDDVTTANDPAYQFTDEDLWGILDYSAPIHRGIMIDDTADSEFYFILLLAKREIYYRLATTTAPFYPLSAEGASLQKNIRFDHYIKLVETVTDEYDKLYAQKFGRDEGEDPTGTGGVVTTYNIKLFGKDYVNRYNQLSNEIDVELVASQISETSINLDWSKYSSTHGSDFLEYCIYVSDDIIFDEYSPNGANITVTPIHVIKDIRKTKVRVTDLEPNKEYFLLVEVKSTRSITGIAQINATTKSHEIESPDEELEIGGNN